MKSKFPPLAALATTLMFATAAAPGLRAEDAQPAANPPPAEKAAEGEAWLGVLTKNLPRMVGDHLGLPAGQGLSVEMVVADSPAAKAGLQKDDVLVKLGDQRLLLPGQLSILVQGHKPGQSATLEVLRDGKPVTLEVTMTARPAEYARRAPVRGESPDAIGGGGVVPNDGAGELALPFPMDGDMDIAQMEKNLERMREHLQEHAARMAQGLQQGQAEGQVNMQVFRLDQGRVQIGDNDGTIIIEKKDGVMTLTAKDKEGKVQFEGPYATDEDKARVPEEIRKRASRFKFEDGGMGLQQMFDGPVPPCDGPAPAEEAVQPGDRVD